ncbi:MAG: phosphatase family protein [Daejeonella sp.]|nr:phosphatase family protein [Daejeonella sp.]
MIDRRKKILFYVIGLILVGFILLTFLVSAFPASMLDRSFSEEVQENHNPALDIIMKVISWFGYMPFSVLIVFCTAAVFYLFKYKKEAVFILLTLTSGVVSTAVKIAVDRPRPTKDMVTIIEKAGHQSFPSGHTLFYVMFFGFLVILMRHLKSIRQIYRWVVTSICLFLIFTIPFSRIYLGAHWFTDVLGGFMLGVICLFLLSYLYFIQPKSKIS